MNKRIGRGLALKRASGLALHKYDPDIYIIYVWTYCVSRTKKCGYGRMVKFLFAKEKTRVRFPLSAQDGVIYLLCIDYDKMIKGFGIAVRNSVVILSALSFPPPNNNNIVINY